MFFTAAFALAAASLVMAQDVAINEATLTQCAQSTLSFAGTGGSYYVAVVPAENPCGSDAFAEFYDVTSSSVDYYAKIPAGTQVQVYVADQNSGQEWWGGVMTVGDGDAACLASDNAASSSAPASSSSPTVYVPPAATGGSTYTPSSNSNSGGSVANNDTPANAVQDTTPTGGASTITASTTLLVGAFAAAIALF